MTTTRLQKTVIDIVGTQHLDGVGQVIEIDGLWSDNFEENSTKAEKRNMDPCACCGRAVRPDRGFNVWVVNGGGALAPVSAWAEMSNYQGSWVGGDLGTYAVGPDCGKQIPAEYRQARSGS